MKNLNKYLAISYLLKTGYKAESITATGAAALVWKCFQNDVKGDYRLGREPLQEIFISWLRGLPGVVSSEDFLLRSAVDFMAGILQESEAEKAKYSESDAEDLAAYLVWREVSKLAA